LPAAGGGPADKKGAKKETKEVKKEAKDVKKGGKGGKGGESENSLKIGQWTITPAIGSVAPDSTVAVEVKFNGSGQKLFEQKIAVSI
jgi:hydrocephalus-inducing protein